MWKHIRNAIGWEGLSFVTLASFAFGFLFANKFLPAKVCFWLAAASLILRFGAYASKEFGKIRIWAGLIFSLVVLSIQIFIVTPWIDREKIEVERVAKATSPEIHITHGGDLTSSQPHQQDLSEIQKALEEIKKNTARKGQLIISAAQMAVIKELDAFIVEDDEMSLRKKFGFPEMVEKNIRGNINNLHRYRRTGQLTHYVLPPGETLIDSRFANGHIRRQGGAFLADFDDTTVFFILLPKDHSDAVAHLKKIENSPELPTSILGTLKEFDAAVSQNNTYLIEVQNAAMNESHDYFLEYYNPGSPYFHKIDDIYLGKFIQLRPKADKVRDAIRKFLGVN